MADAKRVINVHGSVQILEIETATCDRPPEFKQIKGLSMSAVMIDGQAKIAMSIWLPDSVDGLTAIMTHDELLNLNFMIKTHHDLICTGEHERETKQ